MSYYKVIFFIYFFIFVSIGFFFSPFLLQKGSTLVINGYLTNIGLSLMIFFYFFWGFLTDKKLSHKFVLIFNLIITSIIFTILILSNNKFLLSISFILSFSSFMVLAPILDGLVINNMKDKKYNKIRAWGSLGAGSSYFINTFFLKNFSYEILIFINIIFLMLLIFFIYIIKENKTYNNKIKLKEGIITIYKNKSLIFIFIFAFLTYGTLKADDPFSIQYNSEFVNLSALTIGIVGSLAIFFESFTMNIFSTIKFKKKSNIFFLSAFILLIIYFCRFYFYNVKILIILGNIFIGLFIGLFIPGAIATINKNSNKNIKNTVLAIYQIFISLGGIVLGFITTLFLQKNNFLPNIYLVHTFIIFIAVLLIIAFKKYID